MSGLTEQDLRNYAADGDGSAAWIENMASMLAEQGIEVVDDIADEGTFKAQTADKGRSDGEPKADKVEVEAKTAPEAKVEAKTADPAPAEADDDHFSKEDIEALNALRSTRSQQRSPLRDEIQEMREKLARQEGYFQALQRGDGKAEQPKKIRATGVKEVDDYLAEQGLLDNTPPEISEAVERVNSKLAELEQRERGAELGRKVLGEAHTVAKVFDLFDPQFLAETAIRANVSPLEIAQAHYQSKGLLGADGVPTVKFSTRQGGFKAMPQAKGAVGASTPAGTAPKATQPQEQGGVWTPTNDPAERAKRLKAAGF